jgi:hypothetical protein
MNPEDWRDDARTIIAWANGEAVNVDELVVDLEWWSNHFATTAALWPDLLARGGTTEARA